MNLLQTQPFTDQNKGLVQITSGKLRKGDLLVFHASVTGGKRGLVCESATIWSGQTYEKIKSLPLFVSAWRNEKCGCWISKYEHQKDDFGDNWRMICCKCGKVSHWHKEKVDARLEFQLLKTK